MNIPTVPANWSPGQVPAAPTVVGLFWGPDAEIPAPHLEVLVDVEHVRRTLEAIDSGEVTLVADENGRPRVRIALPGMTRDDLQNAIRSLREARDEVYGADE